MENIIISNKEDFEKKKKLFKEQGKEKIHIIADFDKTLTTAFIEGAKVQSTVAILRNQGYLGEEYAKQAFALFEKYHPYEIDPALNIEKKKQLMHQWWKEHFDLIIKSGLHLNDLKDILKKGYLKLRENSKEFYTLVDKTDIPLIILSASGLGNLIQMILEKYNFLNEDTHIITNIFEFDESGNATKVKEPFIHSLNKDETVLENFEFFNKIQNRKNVILMGDSPSDLKMIKGFEYENLIKIGFLNDKVEERLEEFKKNFDLIILNDGSLEKVNELLKEIVEF